MHLETLDSTSVLWLEGILNSELTNQKHRNAGGKSGAKQTMKRTLVYSMSAETSRQNVTLFDLCWEQSHQVTQIFHHSAMSENDRESGISLDVEVRNKCANAESVNNES